MWLLPYTIVSATLLIISIMLLKNKNADVSMKDTDDNSGQKAVPVNVLLYTILLSSHYLLLQEYFRGMYLQYWCLLLHL